jgi:hypothetical protein
MKRSRAKVRVGAEIEVPADLTAEMMRSRVQANIDAHLTRGFDRPACVEYVRELFAEFPVRRKRRCINAVVELAPEQYADFWRSQAYLDGTRAP